MSTARDLQRWARLRRDRGSRKLLRSLFTESPALLAWGVSTGVAQSALLVPIALIVRHVFDHQLKQHDTGAIALSGLAILLLYSAAALLGYLSRDAAVRATTGIVAKLRVDMLAKFHALPQEWHDQQRAGLVHSLIVQDSERVERMLGELASPILPAGLVGAALTVVALALSPRLFLALVLILPLLLGITYVIGRRTRRRTQTWAASSRQFAAETHRMLRAATLTRVEGAEGQQDERSRRLTTALAADMRALGAARALHGAAHNLLGAVAGSLVLIVGGIAVARDSITLGGLLAFYAVLALLLRQLQTASGAANDVALGFESLSRIEPFLEAPEEEPYSGGETKLRFRGGVTLEDVTFSYADTPVIRNVDLEIRRSERIAVVGPNGAGKSTLVSLIMGLYRPALGRVLADGVPLERLEMRDYRRQVGVVLQDPVLFPGTIRENIAFGRPGASSAEIAQAAATATAAAFIEDLPDAYETPVGDEGVGLSGGQRQRIAIARALLGEPGLLLFDEPTTYLDERAVAALMANLGRLPQAPTVVLVTHDPQAARHAHRLVELREGRIVSDSATAAARTAGGAG